LVNTDASNPKYRLIAAIIGRQSWFTDGKTKRQNHQQSGRLAK
jgi:hypothetical protein